MSLREELQRIEPNALVKAYEKFIERFDEHEPPNHERMEEEYPAFFQLMGHLGTETMAEGGTYEEGALVTTAVLKVLIALREYGEDIALGPNSSR